MPALVASPTRNARARFDQLWLCGGVLLALAQTPFVMRLGPEPARAVHTKNPPPPRCNARPEPLYWARELRPTLPRCAAQSLPVELGADCTLHVAVANPSPRDTLSFRIGIRRKNGAVEQAALQQVAPAQDWVDLRVPLADSASIRKLELSVEGEDAALGAFSRPNIVCAQSVLRKRPANVLLISLDTLRADRVGAFGNADGLTPNLDRIAGEGAVFTQAYAHYPNTFGSHAALFTGQYTSVAVRRDRGATRKLAPDGTTTLAAAFAAQGYVTAAFTEDGYVGSAFGFGRGFDRYHDGPADTDFAGQADETFARAVRWLEQRPDAPFFMFLHTYQVHTPYTPSPEALSKLRAALPDYAGPIGDQLKGVQTLAFNAGRLKLGPSDVAWISGLYDGEVSMLDRSVGWLFSQLAELGLLDSTLIVLTADHGEEFAEHGYLAHGDTLHEQALHVPLMFWGPRFVQAGRRIDQPIGLMDVGPTIAELLDAPPPFKHVPARSRAAWLRGAPSEGAGPVFSELVESPVVCAVPHGLKSCPYDGVSLRDREYTYIEATAVHEERLYRRDTDRAEAVDIAATEPATTRHYRALVTAFRRAHPADHRPAAPSNGIDAATEQKMRALGYVR